MTRILQLDIPLLLPEVDDAADGCVTRLIAELDGRPGVEQAHVIEAGPESPARLCIHYAPDIVALPRIRDLVTAAGARISDRFGHLLLAVDGIGYQRRARTVAARLRQLPGVLEAQANMVSMLRVEFDRQQISADAIVVALSGMGVGVRADSEAAGPPVAPPPAHGHAHDHGPARDHAHDHARPSAGVAPHDHSHGSRLGPHGELIFALMAGVSLLAGFAISRLAPDAPLWLSRSAYAAAYGFGGFFTLREAIDNLKLRRFEIDTLMLVAAVGAAVIGAYAEGALLLFLFSLGHALEHFAMGRARHAIEALGRLAPETALVVQGDTLVERPVAELRIGDRIRVRPDSRIAADGFVVEGVGSVDQSPITGESIAVDKQAVADPAVARIAPQRLAANHIVYAGTINGATALAVEVTRVAGDSMLARMVQLVSEAETQKSPTQRLTERFERWFVPLVLVLAVALLLAPLVIDEPFSASFYRAMAVLVAASPCALAIATPSAILSGVARAARDGVLVKGGGPLEMLGAINAIAFDKTGTLTHGEPRIRDIYPAPGITTQELMTVAMAVESLSDHPLARAIVRDGDAHAGGRALPPVTHMQSHAGLGVSATIAGETVLLGKSELFEQVAGQPPSAAMAAANRKLHAAGQTTMMVQLGSRALGVIGLSDTPRQDARQTIAELHRLGISRLVMLSGDHQQVADAIATDVGIDLSRGGLMPADKVAAVRQMRGQGTVAMVGDGVNDAPAMAAADVGIAMGAAGSDVALETADVALMADNLGRLPFAIGLGRRTRAIIRQNLVVSLGMVAVLVPATLFGLGIGPAVALHEGSTLLVVFNALRLLAYRHPAATPAPINPTNPINPVNPVNPIKESAQ